MFYLKLWIKYLTHKLQANLPILWERQNVEAAF